MVVSEDDKGVIDAIVAAVETVRAMGYAIARNSYGLDRYDPTEGWTSDQRCVCPLSALILCRPDRKNPHGLGNLSRAVTGRNEHWVAGFLAGFDGKIPGDHPDMKRDDFCFGYGAGEEVARRVLR